MPISCASLHRGSLKSGKLEKQNLEKQNLEGEVNHFKYDGNNLNDSECPLSRLDHRTNDIDIHGVCVTGDFGFCQFSRCNVEKFPEDTASCLRKQFRPFQDRSHEDIHVILQRLPGVFISGNLDDRDKRESLRSPPPRRKGNEVTPGCCKAGQNLRLSSG